MTADEAVAECREAFEHDHVMWPKILVEYLDQPPNEVRVFAWIVRCTRRLLQSLGENDPTLEEQLQLFETYVRDKREPAAITETVEQLWVQRSWTQTARTAVVQMFGALAYFRNGELHRHAACTVSIRMLVREAPNPREMMELVFVDFNEFVADSGDTACSANRLIPNNR